MNRFILIPLLCVVILSALSGQERQAKMADQLEARRIAHLTTAIELSSEEAKTFWPVYNNFRSAQKAFRSDRKSNDEEITPDEQLEQMIELEQAQLDLKKEYAEKIKQIIGPERTIKFYKENRKFNEKMIKGLREKRGKREMKRMRDKGF